MKAVGVRELKNRLSEYLREVREGERVLITDRGKVIAELRAAEPGTLEPLVDAGLAQLAKRGLIRLGGPNQPELYRKFRKVLRSGRLEQLLDEERGTR